MSIPPTLPTSNTAEESRKLYLHHERSVKSIGLLYFLAAFFLGLAGIVALLDWKSLEWSLVLVGALCLVLSVAYIFTGRWLRRLDSRAITPTTILAAIGLIGFPIGTLINGYILYLIHSHKGHVVFSTDYKTVIEATPHIRSGTSAVIWIVLILILAIVILAPLIIMLTT